MKERPEKHYSQMSLVTSNATYPLTLTCLEPITVDKEYELSGNISCNAMPVESVGVFRLQVIMGNRYGSITMKSG